ncbi:hypothetical protein [Streptacidiphilus cavernicola]|uniref:Small CPxCG-related zinc finger protein n=1 Tax=Streptacidiphilus cavernicola TaxID=3342716 RepID=A0ABV6VZM7_9ACTN
MNDVDEPSGTAAGYCHRCETWTPDARVVAEIHSDAGAGGTVVRCQACDLDPKPRAPHSSDPRRYPR